VFTLFFALLRMAMRVDDVPCRWIPPGLN